MKPIIYFPVPTPTQNFPEPMEISEALATYPDLAKQVQGMIANSLQANGIWEKTANDVYSDLVLRFRNRVDRNNPIICMGPGRVVAFVRIALRFAVGTIFRSRKSRSACQLVSDLIPPNSEVEAGDWLDSQTDKTAIRDEFASATFFGDLEEVIRSVPTKDHLDEAIVEALQECARCRDADFESDADILARCRGPKPKLNTLTKRRHHIIRLIAAKMRAGGYATKPSGRPAAPRPPKSR